MAGTTQMALDGAGNVVLAVSGKDAGTSPALRVLAESSGTYYGVAMTAGDIYTVAGGPSNTLATLSDPTSLINIGSGNLYFTDGSASSANLDEFSGAPTANLVPTVTAVSPTNGPAAGGTSVTVTGTNLTGATAVDFGGPATRAPRIGADTGTSLTVISPAGTGTVNVTVTTPNGTSTTSSADQFTYNAPALPTVTVVSPTNGPAAGGTSVTVTGTNLTGATAVDFGGTGHPGTSIGADTGTSLTVVSPAGTGTVNVTVTTPNGTSTTSSADQFTYTPRRCRPSPRSAPRTDQRPEGPRSR